MFLSRRRQLFRRRFLLGIYWLRVDILSYAATMMIYFARDYYMTLLRQCAAADGS